MNKITSLFKQENKQIEESVLDTTKEILNPAIFTNNKMKSDVSDYIVDIFTKWRDEVLPSAIIEDIVLIGSSAGYNYNSSSDIDLNVKVSGVNNEELKSVLSMLPNGNLLPNTEHPINYFLVTDDNAVKQADNAYDLLNDSWIKDPVKENIKVPYNYILEIAKVFMSGIDNRIMEYESDVKELNYYKSLLNDKESDDDDIQERIGIKEEEIKADLDALYIAHNVIRAFRGEAFKDEMGTEYLIKIENDSPNYSINNMVYKIMESSGYFDKLIKLEKERDRYK